MATITVPHELTSVGYGGALVHENRRGKALNEAEGMGILAGGFSTGRGLWSSARNGESLHMSFVSDEGSR
jgi:hypothetical protein